MSVLSACILYDYIECIILYAYIHRCLLFPFFAIFGAPLHVHTFWPARALVCEYVFVHIRVLILTHSMDSLRALFWLLLPVACRLPPANVFRFCRVQAATARCHAMPSHAMILVCACVVVAVDVAAAVVVVVVVLSVVFVVVACRIRL